MKSWIRMVSDADAGPELKEMLDRVRTPHGTVDNVMRVHSLRPQTMAGHVALYRSVLHNPANTLPFWFLEVLACCTSIVNRCDYSLTHHFMNVRRLLRDDERAFAIRQALEQGAAQQVFAGKELALVRYVSKLTAHVGDMAASDIEALRSAGCEDGEILEANQVCAYFNYSNRLLNGLGVTTEGDVIGYYKEGDKHGK
jgi:uncharacterized peroxidase-related enzyme